MQSVAGPGLGRFKFPCLIFWLQALSWDWPRGSLPVPLLTLVVSETLRHDIRSGVRVALAPIITDLPIILLTLLVSTQLSRFKPILGGFSILGGLFVFFLGVQCLRTKAWKLTCRPRNQDP